MKSSNNMMRLGLLTILFSGILLSQQTFAQTNKDVSLTVEKIMKDIKWIGASPSNISWTWDSKAIIFSWNPDKNIADSFYIYKLNSKQPEKLNYNEALKYKAINNGKYNKNYTSITYSYKGDIYLLNIATGIATPITQTEEQESNPSFMNNDEWIVYHKNKNLFAWQIKTGLTKQLTNFVKDAERSVKNNNNVQDVFLTNQSLANSSVLQWRKKKKESRDQFLELNKEKANAKAIAFGDKQLTTVEASNSGNFVLYTLFNPDVSKNTIVPAYVTESGYTTDIPGREKVGHAQGNSESFIYNKLLDTTYAIKLDSIPGSFDKPDYVKDYPKQGEEKEKKNNKDAKDVVRKLWINEVYWNESNDQAVVDIRSVDNKDRWIMALDPATAKLSLINRQRDEAWVGGPGNSNYRANAGWLNDHSFYFQSEQTGYSHLYVYDINNKSTTALTKGNYEVQDAVLSKNKKAFYIITNEVHPGQQNWYKLNIETATKEKLTNKVGTYEVSMSPDEKTLAYRYSFINKPWELFVQENKNTNNIAQITFKGASEEFKEYPWRENKIFTITARDGQPIYARLYEPKTGTKNNAAVIFVHGAGYLQNVHFGWSNNYPREYMFNNLLADKGYTVIDIDYRGSAGYGRDWRTGIYRFMGGKDLDDEVDAAKYLVSNLGIDSTRIGMYGGSYGGFMTLMALFTQPNVIKAGAALRPVTDWAHYNHGYTSDILNEPATDSIAYARSSPINFAAGLKNNLLICHGMVDVNVHYQDAVRLAQKLIELGKDNWELASYPMEDHGFVEPSSWTDEYKRILKLFNNKLNK
jgi:dipeptidyl aminopeptidase/acylaminoacyl peptidase